jgi:uncharacterized protein YcfJ
MSTSKLVSGILVGAVLAASAAHADSHEDYRRGDQDRGRGSDDGYDYARVVDVDPIIRHVRVTVPRQECYEETRYRTRDDGRGYPRNGTAGHTILGAIIGAGIGNSIGSGDGRRAATVAGAIIGSAIGHDVGERRREQGYYGRDNGPRDEPYTTQHCETRYDESYEDRTDGYRVTYEYNGQRYTTQTRRDPGERIRVRVNVTPEEC